MSRLEPMSMCHCFLEDCQVVDLLRQSPYDPLSQAIVPLCVDHAFTVHASGQSLALPSLNPVAQFGCLRSPARRACCSTAEAQSASAAARPEASLSRRTCAQHKVFPYQDKPLPTGQQLRSSVPPEGVSICVPVRVIVAATALEQRKLQHAARNLPCAVFLLDLSPQWASEQAITVHGDVQHTWRHLHFHLPSGITDLLNCPQRHA